MKVITFPGLDQLNQFRDKNYRLSHDSEKIQYSTPKKTVNFLCHKVVSVICLPANAIGAVAGLAGAAISACTIGAVKVGVFAVTLGNVKLPIPTGFVWCLERTGNCVLEICVNLGECLADLARLITNVVDGIVWVVRELGLENIAQQILAEIGRLFQRIGRVLEFIGNRLDAGWKKASAAESLSDFEAIYPINLLNEAAKPYRILRQADDFKDQGRELLVILKHYAWSIPNILANGVGAVGTGFVVVALSIGFLAKVALYAGTGADVRIPTFAPHAIKATFAMVGNTLLDVGTDIADVFVLIYKASEAVGIVRVIAKLGEVISYIPEACCGE